MCFGTQDLLPMGVWGHPRYFAWPQAAVAVSYAHPRNRGLKMPGSTPKTAVTDHTRIGSSYRGSYLGTSQEADNIHLHHGCIDAHRSVESHGKSFWMVRRAASVVAGRPADRRTVFLMCNSLGSTLRTALASFYVSDTDWYLIGGILSVMAILHQLSGVRRGAAWRRASFQFAVSPPVNDHLCVINPMDEYNPLLISVRRVEEVLWDPPR